MREMWVKSRKTAKVGAIAQKIKKYLWKNKDAKPDSSYWQWFSMSICSGIGCGLVFWAMGEPMYHFMTPPAAIQAATGSREAAIFAVSQAMFDWSFVQYFIYTLPALAFALLCFNYQKSLSMAPILKLTGGKNAKRLTTFFLFLV